MEGDGRTRRVRILFGYEVFCALGFSNARDAQPGGPGMSTDSTRWVIFTVFKQLTTTETIFSHASIQKKIFIQMSSY